MAEAEGSESGAASAATDGAAGVDPFAAAMALGGASRATADAFLDDQRSLIGIQKHHLDEQSRHLREQLRLGIWEKRLGVLLRLATAFTGLAIAAGLAFLIWDASGSSGLVIEPFSVPPDLAARGLTGQVVAAKILDRIVVLESQTVSSRAPKSYANSWDEQDLKIEIPETGLSLGQLDNFLREKLGHDTHVTGEIVRTPTGLSLTARAGGSDSVAGSEADLDALIRQTAERVYKLTQPYRYGVYLNSNNRAAESVAVFREMTQSGPAQERAWGYNGWYISIIDSDSVAFQLALLRRGVALAPEIYILESNLANLESNTGQAEQALRDYRTSLSLITNSDTGQLRAELAAVGRLQIQASLDGALGAFHDDSQLRLDAIGSGMAYGQSTLTTGLARSQVGEHDLPAARHTLANPVYEVNRNPGQAAFLNILSSMKVDSEAQNWAAVVAAARQIDPLLPQFPGFRTLAPTVSTPVLAFAEAKLGRFQDAERDIRATPGDCYPCLIARGQIAAAARQWDRADYWFARASGQAPSIPFAETAWGQMLLARGDAAGAIAKFKAANGKGPHFADPLELWGEALMAQNRSDLASAKFEAAQKYAPAWGRLHLKWGEALAYAGKRDDAHKQFAMAAGLELAQTEKAELKRQASGS